MSPQVRNALYVFAGIVLGVGVVLGMGAAANTNAAAAAGDPAKYTVVQTDGTHLIVTDNTANKVFFYAIDQGGKPGDELKFRGTIDLAEVGKPTIKPTKEK